MKPPQELPIDQRPRVAPPRLGRGALESLRRMRLEVLAEVEAAWGRRH